MIDLGKSVYDPVHDSLIDSLKMGLLDALNSSLYWTFINSISTPLYDSLANSLDVSLCVFVWEKGDD
jgi:hypothetical protein